MDTGPLILRLVVGLLLVGHGVQKLFGRFGGYGLAGTGGYLAGLGYRPGVPFALLAGVSEQGSGLLLALGLGTPVAGALLVATMVNVYAGHAGKGPWNSDGGWELPLLYALVGAALAFTGAGAFSLDAALGWDLTGNGWGAAATSAGLAAGLTTLLTRHRADPVDTGRTDVATA
ncbi:MAG: Membrane protein, distant similarity to thiosulphate:quinone oxidoreductase DoxD [uncultured Thermomicrobiales bacterium]|uniref:Membrane protein, distant similarity to thiosulphate:quinone oxidoreductase DoxD n=1 Tax=uncultured Thermomicrobiales bacterium TaxID=1645740 RepID=A0A6J4UV83_9BACT|nr:MAG: Membrane protein, distant similarity to thiosulphate:quinone oxidoreductase DoxD [uncultured Thermomicrobiales bacterium]